MISLIMATYGRKDEITLFIESLLSQTDGNFELIIVDQNPLGYLESVLGPYQGHPRIVYVHVDQRGLSLARNTGMKISKGEIIGFPDDDCIYPPGTIASVNQFFYDHPEKDVLTGKCRATVASKHTGFKFASGDAELTPHNIWGRHISISMFFRRAALEGCNFDERMGAGTTFGSCEESDLLLRVLYRGGRGYYDNTLELLHPEPLQTIDEPTINKSYIYGMGQGALVRKHTTEFKNPRLLRRFIWNAARQIVAVCIFAIVDRHRARYYAMSLTGKINGYINFPN